MGEVKHAKVKSRKKQPVPHRVRLRDIKLLTYEDPCDCWHGFFRVEIGPGMYVSGECHGLHDGPGDGGDGDYDDDSNDCDPSQKLITKYRREFLKKIRDLGYIVSEE